MEEPFDGGSADLPEGEVESPREETNGNGNENSGGEERTNAKSKMGGWDKNQKYLPPEAYDLKNGKLVKEDILKIIKEEMQDEGPLSGEIVAARVAYMNFYLSGKGKPCERSKMLTDICKLREMQINIMEKQENMRVARTAHQVPQICFDVVKNYVRDAKLLTAIEKALSTKFEALWQESVVLK